jgi:hypothetical protein
MAKAKEKAKAEAHDDKGEKSHNWDLGPKGCGAVQFRLGGAVTVGLVWLVRLVWLVSGCCGWLFVGGVLPTLQPRLLTTSKRRTFASCHARNQHAENHILIILQDVL